MQFSAQNGNKAMLRRNPLEFALNVSFGYQSRDIRKVAIYEFNELCDVR